MSSLEVVRESEESGAAGRSASPAQFSSASGLSSPPRSSPEASPSAQFAREGGNSNSHHHHHNHHHHHINSSITVNPAGGMEQVSEKPPRRKPGRKPGSTVKPKPDPEGTMGGGEDLPKVKRPRKPRDPNAAPTRPRKKKESLESSATSVGELHSVPSMSRPVQPPPASTEPTPTFHVPGPLPAQASTPTQNGNSEGIQRPIQSFFSTAPPPPASSAQPNQQQVQAQPQPQPPPPPPSQPMRTSGQNYDPIRSNYNPVRETVVAHNAYSNSQGSPGPSQHTLNRASASPSISSLVDPPNQPLASPSIAAQSFFNQQYRVQGEGRTSVPASPTVNRLAAALVPEPSALSKPSTPAPEMAKKIQANGSAPGTSNNTKKVGSTAASSTAASPKPVAKSKEIKDTYVITPPALPGSGLMQLGGPGAGDGTEFRAPTVILNIPLNGEPNKYVNFTKLAEQQYGWDALHPRLAAQRDRLARVAAAGAALERNGSNKESGDEMSLDSDAEGSNVEMGGMSDGRTGTDAGAKKVPRKRKMKEDEYDKDDGFVDDSELLWEEQAAAANDGFFVYSGPLVPEGKKPAVETRADGAPKRGRGRGSRGGRGGSTRGGAAAVAALRNGLPAHGPGSRGGSTTRKPRITKADRARMEQEKLEREKLGSMASGSMQSNFGNMAQLASAPTLGSTPMVFNQ